MWPLDDQCEVQIALSTLSLFHELLGLRSFAGIIVGDEEQESDALWCGFTGMNGSCGAARNWRQKWNYHGSVRH
jgi:hypothetical protein